MLWLGGLAEGAKSFSRTAQPLNARGCHSHGRLVRQVHIDPVRSP